MKVSDTKVEKELAEVKQVQPRDPNAAIRGRNLFLAEAAKLSRGVSPEGQKRHTEWNEKFTIRKPKGRFAMVSLISIIVAVALALGGVGVVQASQSSMPTDGLYPVKLLTEDLTTSLTFDPEKLIDLYLKYADRRVQEIASENQSGSLVEESVYSRFLAEIESALQLTDQVPEADLEQVLLKLQDRLQTQDQLMQQLQTLATSQNEPLMTQTHQRIQERLRVFQSGTENPIQLRDAIREQLRTQDQLNAPENAQQGQPSGANNGYGSYQMTPPAPGTGGNSFGQGAGDDVSGGYGAGFGAGSGAGDGNGSGEGTGSLLNCTCPPTPTGTVVYGEGTPTPTPCTCPIGTGSGFGNQGTPQPGGRGPGGKP
jgi:hypothetical protein